MTGDLIDKNQLLSLKELNEPGEDDIVTELIDIFITHTPKTLVRLRESQTSQNRDDIVKLAHKLKGSSANLGALFMRQICQQLEEEGQTISWEEIDQKISMIEDMYQKVSKILVDDWREESAS